MYLKIRVAPKISSFRKILIREKSSFPSPLSRSTGLQGVPGPRRPCTSLYWMARFWSTAAKGEKNKSETQPIKTHYTLLSLNAGLDGIKGAGEIINGTIIIYYTLYTIQAYCNISHSNDLRQSHGHAHAYITLQRNYYCARALN